MARKTQLIDPFAASIGGYHLSSLDRKRTGKGSNRVWKHPQCGCADYQNEGRAYFYHGLLGVGTPRGLQGRICALMLLILSLFKRLKGLFGGVGTLQGRICALMLLILSLFKRLKGCLARKTQLIDPFAASIGGYHLSSENVLLPRAARGKGGI